ncbi:dihydroorotate dehydrogenase (quinone)- mitochondrial [Apiospora kogelbergensis]|uniref:dihydroorotate dehydrogenase (quinone)- mitochondrial n=1 Tax=Apiospora kogelbergensis TaxID=1337665 RepID=UPI00312F13C1
MASSVRLTQRAVRSSTAILAQSLTRQQCPRISRTALPGKRLNSTTTTTPSTAASTPSPTPPAPAPASSPAPTPSPSTSYSYSSRSESYTASRAKILLYSTALATTGYLAYFYATDTRASVHQWVVPRLIRTVWPDAEDAHDVGVRAMKSLYPVNLHVRERSTAAVDARLGLSVFGHQLSNPIGISAGLDKHADIIDPLFALGAGVVEVGGCTPLAQPGNPKPRMFRVAGIDGLINRYGLNSHGADDMAMRLRNRVRLYARANGLTEAEVLNGENSDVPPGSLAAGRLLAVQIAKNKDTPEQDVGAVSRDYTYCVSRLAPYADILVVNVSSPNTPGLRDLQAVEPLTEILSAVVDEARRAERKTKPKVMVKVSPDEDEEAQMEGIVQAVWRSGVDGVIVGNTTKRRVGVVPPGVAVTSKEAATLGETGGYSGPMMFGRTLELVKRYRKMLDGQSLALTQPGRDGKRSVHEEKNDIADEAVGASLGALEGTASGMVPDDMTKTPLSKTSTRGRETVDGSRSQKVIFATGGISTGEQALQILNAGASLAMVYTGLVYGVRAR